MNFSIQSRKIGFFNADASFGGRSSFILQFKNNDTISKFEKGPKPGDNVLKYTGRIGCSALTDLFL